MLFPILLFIAGLLIIIVAGDKFVDASVSIAKRLGVSELIIGATVVSLGTTLPEVLVSTTASFSGSADIAIGNALGSIICNTAFIAGLTQFIRPAKDIDASALRWRAFFFFAAEIIILVFGLGSGHYGLAAGLILVSMFFLYTWLNISMEKSEDGPADSEEAKQPILGHICMLAISALLLFIGAKLLVDNGIILARALGVPERVIAVTIIALGTSLPELVTAITALIKGHAAVSVGNILGANILNLLLVIGIPAVIRGITPSVSAVQLDIPVSILVMAVLTLPMLTKRRGYRAQGGLLLLIYAGYCTYTFIGG